MAKYVIVNSNCNESEEITSVIAFGKARVVDGNERLEAFKALVEKYSGDQPAEAKHKEITGCTQSYIIAIDVEHITGKEAIEYVNAKK